MLHNLWDAIPTHLPGELIEVLLRSGNVRIERIVSQGHASPPDFWYDQAEDEWVVLLQGAARLRLIDPTGQEQIRKLHVGDFLHIPAHQRHRVDWTLPDQTTLWLAVFFVNQLPVGDSSRNAWQ